MAMTIRCRSELRNHSDRSNYTLRWNRSLKQAGMVGGFDDDFPSANGFVGMLGAALFGAALIGLFLVLMLSLGE